MMEYNPKNRPILKIPNLRDLYPGMGSNWESSGFPVIKLTVVHQVHMLPACAVVLSVKTNMCQSRKAHEDHEHICSAFVFASDKTPN